ncbi:MAG: hypothetical protein KDB82_04490, partial [Planctomycetes bacterium]|nr:hypothetical protein [Planctomycetota bacterium]
MKFLAWMGAAALLLFITSWKPRTVVAAPPVMADDKPAPSPLDSLEPRKKALLDATRWLLKPAGQEQALSGLFYQPCPLPPLSAEGKGKLSLPEVIRLWGVLESGYPDKAKLEPVVDRFRKTKSIRVKGSLGPLAVEALCARAALHRGLIEERHYKSLLKDYWRSAEADTAATEEKGPWLDDKIARPQWYANVMWRAILLKCVIRAEIADSSKQFGHDLDELLDIHSKLSSRFSVHRDSIVGEITELLHVNLFGFAALNLAAQFPESAVSKDAAAKVKTALETADIAMAYVNRIQWFARGGGAYRAARGTLLQVSGRVATPPGANGDGVSWLMGVQLACQRIDGAFDGNATLCAHLGLDSEPEEFTPDYAALVETAMTVPMLAGGLFAERSDLSDMDVEDCNKMIQALIEAHRDQAPRALASKFEKRVAVAILDGCDYLESIQTDKGGFGSDSNMRMGVHGLCLMALLHGGRDRNSAAVKRGLEFIENNEWGFKDGAFGGYTYDASVLLMLLQLYYEKELKQSGMLEADTPNKYKEARQAMWKLLPEDHRRRIDQLVEIIGGHRTGPDSGYTYRKYPDRDLAS